jgi:hypothetical protein
MRLSWARGFDESQKYAISCSPGFAKEKKRRALDFSDSVEKNAAIAL